MSEESVEIVRRVYEHWDRGDYASVALFMTPDVEFARYGAALGSLQGEWRGFDEIRTALAEYLTAWEDIRNTPDDIIDLGGDRVLVLDRQTGRGKTSGVAAEHEMASLFTLRERKIVRIEAYWDRAEALKAAGLSE
jgi:ketosteroid isomerase-like protein